MDKVLIPTAFSAEEVADLRHLSELSANHTPECTCGELEKLWGGHNPTCVVHGVRIKSDTASTPAHTTQRLAHLRQEEARLIQDIVGDPRRGISVPVCTCFLPGILENPSCEVHAHPLLD